MKSCFFDPEHPKFIGRPFADKSTPTQLSAAEEAYARRKSLGGKRKRCAWSEYEIEQLRKGVQRYGYGRWKMICDAYNFDDRTPIDLKDKARNLVHAEPQFFTSGSQTASLSVVNESVPTAPSNKRRRTAQSEIERNSHNCDDDKVAVADTERLENGQCKTIVFNLECFSDDEENETSDTKSDSAPVDNDTDDSATEQSADSGVTDSSRDNNMQFAKFANRPIGGRLNRFAKQTNGFRATSSLLPRPPGNQHAYWPQTHRQQATEKRLRPSGEVSQSDRLLAFETAYGVRDRARCLMCLTNEVHTDRKGYDLAHIVPRKWRGNNTAVWNRVATCATCNADVAQDNLLDVVAERFPQSLPRIVDVLWQQFRASEPTIAKKLASGGREAFVRFVYGPRTMATAADTQLKIFAQRQLPHWKVDSDASWSASASIVQGLAMSPRLYQALRIMDQRCEKIKHLDSEIETTSATIAYLQQHLDEKVRERQTTLAIKSQQ